MPEKQWHVKAAEAYLGEKEGSLSTDRKHDRTNVIHPDRAEFRVSFGNTGYEPGPQAHVWDAYNSWGLKSDGSTACYQGHNPEPAAHKAKREKLFEIVFKLLHNYSPKS